MSRFSTTQLQGVDVDMNKQDWKLELLQKQSDSWLYSMTISACRWNDKGRDTYDHYSSEKDQWEKWCPVSGDYLHDLITVQQDWNGHVHPVEAVLARIDREMILQFRLVVCRDLYDPKRLWLMHTHLVDGERPSSNPYSSVFQRISLRCIGRDDRLMGWDQLTSGERIKLFGEAKSGSTLYPFPTSDNVETGAWLAAIYKQHYSSYLVLPTLITNGISDGVKESARMYCIVCCLMLQSIFPHELIQLICEYCKTDNVDQSFTTMHEEFIHHNCDHQGMGPRTTVAFTVDPALPCISTRERLKCIEHMCIQPNSLLG
jgi:hypothetical protein